MAATVPAKPATDSKAPSDKMATARNGRAARKQLTAKEHADGKADVAGACNLIKLMLEMGNPDWTSASRCLKRAYKSALKLARSDAPAEEGGASNG